MHGDVAVSSAGDVYVSVETAGMGVQVFSADGRYLRSLANAPADLHGFVIRDAGDGGTQPIRQPVSPATCAGRC